ncbi:MAG: hypothetical protein WCR42_10295 [bacterium]
MKKYILLAAFILFSMNFASAKVDLKTEVDTNNVLIGEHITVSLTVTAPKKAGIVWPILSDTAKKIEIIKDFPADTVSKEKNILVLKKNYTLTSFDKGTFALPPAIIRFVKSRDSLVAMIPALQFRTIKVDTTKPIKDIVGPMNQPITFMEILPYILIVLGIAALIYFVIFFLKRYKPKPLAEQSFEPKIPAHLLALQQLRALDEKKLWQNAKVKLYYIELTEIIRSYIEKRFNINAMEMTSGEIKFALNSIDVETTLKNKFFIMLDNADLAKFAKYEPLPDENYGSMKICEEFIDATKIIVNG